MFNSCFWAKKNETNGIGYWLPLYQHLEDTKDVAALLWEHWLSEGQRRIIRNSLNDESKDRAKDLALFVAAIHDLGKATPAFQIKKGYVNSDDLDIFLLEKLERSGFEGISVLNLTSQNQTSHTVAGQYLLYQYGVGDDISTIIGGHHGKPVDSRQTIYDQKSYPNNYYQSEKSESEIYKKWDNAQREIFEWALHLCNFESVKDLPSIKQTGQVILTGLVIMADWIASNPDYFPLILAESDSIPNKQERSKIAFMKWQQTYLWEADYSSDYVKMYQKRFGFEPRNVQMVLSDAIDKANEPGIFIVEAPMGSGKTEAALIATEQLAYKTACSGMFFGLPTQASSNGIFPRILHWLDSISKEQEENVQVRLSHGKAHLNEQFNTLSAGINIDDTEKNLDAGVIVNEWFSGRKTSVLDDFVVGTVDQLLMMALKQKHLALRHLGFSKKVVIIDEVHAYDAYMNQYLLRAVQWLGAYRIPLVILSATLPAERRFELTRTYMSGMGKKWRGTDKERLQEYLQTDHYPLITYSDGEEVYQIREFSQIANKQVDIIKIQEDILFDLVDDSICDGGVVGIIVNTVKRAQELAKKLAQHYGDNQILLLHSSFIGTERVKKEQELLKIIGDKADRPFCKIVIGTQVIEQSLDIDFDVMISDLAPMDLLIQRMGRLHRHKIDRPEKHQKPKFYVLGTNKDYDFEDGSSYVYGDYILARTQYYLPDMISLPQDISTLVQLVYDLKTEINIEDSLTEKYVAYKKQYDTNMEEKKKKAKTYRITEPVWKKSMAKDDTLIAWLNRSIVDDTEEKANAQVRDIEATIEVIALKKMGAGYGLYGASDDLSENITDYKIAKKVAQNTITLPKMLSKSYVIDRSIEALERYTITNLSSWRNSTWLKNSLGIIFDENNEFILQTESNKGDTVSIKIKYDEKYGIQVERM